MPQPFHRSHLGRRLHKLETKIIDEHGFVPHTAKRRAYWLDWLQKMDKAEYPPFKIPEEVARMLLEGEIELPPHKYDDE
jgi:hypothetical protein